MCTLVYAGPTDYLWVYQGSNYVSHQMRSNVNARGITPKKAPIETPTSIGTVEIYYSPFRAAYTKIRTPLYRSSTDADCPSMAVFSVNSTMDRRSYVQSYWYSDQCRARLERYHPQFNLNGRGLLRRNWRKLSRNQEDTVLALDWGTKEGREPSIDHKNWVISRQEVPY